eukprot:TRINITY_DN4987_c0_g1_i1.p1 TRINITY_DN4987_c0_g1~~TRINITY_DN4987_c0_g1_i1.p1  ORF type:complete len:1068 (-),score=284.92 TRINITY_DN4987_c0_g1_i1:229-3432(-)
MFGRGAAPARGLCAAVTTAANGRSKAQQCAAAALARGSSRRFFYDDATPAASSGPSALYLESIYSQWKIDSSKLDPKWDAYFKAVEAGDKKAEPPLGDARNVALSARIATGDLSASAGDALAPPTRHVTVGGGRGLDRVGLKYLIQAYQRRGHEGAHLDPLGTHLWRPGGQELPELEPSFHGFSEADLDKPLPKWLGSTGGNIGFLSGGGLDSDVATLRDLLGVLKKTYQNKIGVEYMHIGDKRRCNWIRDRVEATTFLSYSKEEMMQIYTRLCRADTFERFLGDKFKTTKRFGLDGGEATIPGLEALVDRAKLMGCNEFVIGMPHRGRLNILVNVLHKPMAKMLAEFLGTAYDIDATLSQLADEDWSSTGDVKYHLGTSITRSCADGSNVTLTMEANPSHLETVGPVTLGRTKAKQFYAGNAEDTKKQIMPIILHGDAAFSGQGVVYESMQLQGVDDFSTGGTVHVVVNNQVGFTTDPNNSRTSPYCSDIGKAFNIPIFHCNGDDPVSVVRAFEMAAEWRQEWGEDVIVDVICYRRYGHNETDNPAFTQPVLYKQIDKHQRTERIFAEKLLADGYATAAELEEIRTRIWDQYEADHQAAKEYKPDPASAWVATKWEGFRTPYQLGQQKPTGVDTEVLKQIGVRTCEVPEDFTLHSSLKRILKTKKEHIIEGKDLDWGTCEALAFGSLLLEDYHVRITGQDVERGTFSHRHCLVHDQLDDTEYVFLNNLKLGPQAKFVGRNSILSEYGVLGFETGYSYENPNALIIWEAQFGDFANTAQVMLDQFISAGEHKWLQQSGLTVLLPHGYDGQGSEHSSCRIERFLQMHDGDEDDVQDQATQIRKTNMQVMNITTPANYFHALRMQVHRDFRKPMIIAAPKALLRHKSCVSSLEDVGPGSELQTVIGERNPDIANNPDKVDRLIFCTGKIYYELVEQRAKLGLDNVAICTVEMIAPFPYHRVQEEIAKYPKVDPGDGVHPGSIIWCQEEPKNMGAWQYVKPRFACIAREGLKMDLIMNYIGRRAAASPATGIAKMHTAEQEAVVHMALTSDSPDAAEGRTRASKLLGHQT